MSSGRSFLRVVESSEEFSSGVWKLNRNLVVSNTAVFPDRCVICNEPACGRVVRKSFVWHNPIFLPLIVISFPIYVILASIWNKILHIEIPVCPKHANRMMFFTILSFILLPQVAVMGLLGIIYGLPFLLLSGILSSIIGFVLLIWARNPVWAWFIRSEYGLIKGAHPDFIDSMPEWHGELSPK